MRILVPIAAVLAGTLGLGAAELDLAGTWRLSTPSATNVWDCAVPGDNASALLKAGFLRDPFWKGQEDCVQWLGNADWTFARTFDAESLVKRDLDFKTKPLPASNIRIESVRLRADGAFEVKVLCDAKALFVWLEDSSDPGTRFDDNLVDLEAGGHTFVCRPGHPTTAEELKARLTVRDLSSSVKRVASSERVKVCVVASETEGGTLPNLSSMAVAWDGRRLKWTPNARYSVTNFVRYIELMTATGGNADRDMDEDFKPLLDLCRKALDYGLKPYLKLGNVPVRFTAGCDPRRKKQGGADGGSYGLNIRPPDDYEAYGRYMRSCAAALRDAFGRDEVRSWRFSVMTESNNPGGEGDSGWFAAKGGDNAATLDAFVRIYDVTAKAFEAELGDGLVFGTHLLDPEEQWKSFGYEDVIARCRPLSLLPVSYYFGAPDGDQAARAAVFGGLGDVVRASGKGVISGIDEGRVCFSRPGAKSKDLRTRTVGQSYQAAFNVRLAKTVLDAGGSYIASWGVFAGEDPLFAGVPTFDYFTAREIAKFAGMRRCAARTDGTPPEKEVMDAIAAVSPDGRMVRVAVSRLRDKLEFTEPYDTTVSIVLPAELKTAGRITVSELTLDDRNNWFVDWERERRETGIADADYWASPDDPNPLFSLADDSAKEFFNSRVPAYAAKADRIVPRVRSLSVPSDGVLTFPVSFRGNGAAFFEVRGYEVTLEGLLDEMADPDANTYLDSFPWRGRLWSSYDRTLGNSDWSQYLLDETNADGRVEHVMMDAKGPGALVRLWTANGRDAYLRFYFDGSATPLFEGVGTNLIGGHVICPAPLSAALSPRSPLEHQAQNLYLPLAFAKSLKITVETPNEDKRFWYNAEVREYAAGTPVETVSGEILKRAEGKIEDICAKLLSESVDASSGKCFTGTSLVLEGPATIRALALEAKGTDERNVRVKICFDGVETVDVSLAQLKGLGKTALSMPFRRSCRIEFSSKVSGCVDVAPYRWEEVRSMYFHAKGLDFPKLPTRKEGVSHYDLNWAELTGRGRLVGNALLVGNGYLPPEKKDTWWGEGDEKVWVDGEDFPSYFGTGTEDFFGYAWGEATPYDHPFLKMPVSDRNVFRLRRLDSIPFDRSLKLDVEIWHNHTEPTFVDYSPATFWYAKPTVGPHTEAVVKPVAEELAPLAFETLPAGSIRPEGWLRHQLELQAEGLPGRLYESSRHLKPGNGWLKADADWGWEEQPYWLRTFVKLAALTGDRRLMDVSRQWFEGVLSTARPDGWFGPERLRARPRKSDGKDISDIWPHMVMAEAMLTWYDLTKDKRVLEVLAGFVRWCNAQEDDTFLQWGDEWTYSVQQGRACDLVPVLFRLYGLTGGKACLDLADRLFSRRQRTIDKTFLTIHNVNFAQRFAYETVFSRRSGNPSHRAFADYWYDINSRLWGGEFPRGGFAADECLRVGCFDARYATESCCWGELVRSFGELANLTGETKWCDRTEDVVFNWHPVAYTPDWKRVHYLTAANMVRVDAMTDHNYMDSAPRIAYSSERYRCCLHNAALALPHFAENLTRVGPNGDLVFALYAPHSGRLGATSWRMETRYPFREKVFLELSGLGTRGVRLRVPGWAKGFAVKRNGLPFAATDEAGRWLDLRGMWGETERFEIEMKAVCSLSTHVRTHAVTVDRGPLSYSLDLGEQYRDVPAPAFETAADGTCVGVFPAEKEGVTGERMTEVLPVRDWNYALVRTKKFTFRERPWSDDCFVASNAVCEIVATGRKVAEWSLQDGAPAALQESPVATDAPEETIRFIPMGAARCRLTVLPVVAERGDIATRWRKVPATTKRAERPQLMSQ